MPGERKEQRVESFYEEALTEAELMRLPETREADGFDEELALLRTRLLTAARERPGRLDVLMRGVATLARVTAVRYRMSPQSKEDLAESLAGVVNSIGAAVGLGDFDDAAEG